MTKSERCLAQARVFEARAQVASTHGLAYAILGDGEFSERLFNRAQSFLTYMDEATNNALKFADEEEKQK